MAYSRPMSSSHHTDEGPSLVHTLVAGIVDPALTRFRIAGGSRALVTAAEALRAAGWLEADDAPVVLQDDEVDEPTAPVVVTHHALGLAERVWKGSRSGAETVLRTARWSVEVRLDHVATLGPRLGALILPDSAEDPADLVAEIVHWRTAALTRWSQRTDAERGRTDKELEDELRRAQALLVATQQTLSWRVTAPLRAVRTRQLRKG